MRNEPVETKIYEGVKGTQWMVLNRRLTGYLIRLPEMVHAAVAAEDADCQMCHGGAMDELAIQSFLLENSKLGTYAVGLV